jgi:hypothetical protein
MAIDAIVRVSFQSNTPANQAVNEALVGHKQDARGSQPFERVSTALYRCLDGDDTKVVESLGRLVRSLGIYSRSVDFVSITVMRHQ